MAALYLDELTHEFMEKQNALYASKKLLKRADEVRFRYPVLRVF